MSVSVGDIVVLKSGGPKMTVTSVNNLIGGVSITCKWFSSNLDLVEGSFPDDALTQADPTSSPIENSKVANFGLTKSRISQVATQYCPSIIFTPS